MQTEILRQCLSEDTLQAHELVGFNRAAINESYGGNAGPHRCGVAAVIQDDEVLIPTKTTTPQNEYNVIFGARTTPLEAIPYSDRQRINIWPPLLIDEVLPANDDMSVDMLKQCTRLALEHNLHQVQVYLAGGGDPALLPATEYLPKNTFGTGQLSDIPIKHEI